MDILIKKINNQFIFYDKEIGIDIEELFLKGGLQNQAKDNVTLINDNKWIKKHYLRKGLMSFLGDLYMYKSVKNTRSYKEFSLLNSLYKKEFPTCKPIMGWITRNLVTYTADLIMEYIPSVDLKTYILQSKINEKDWYLIGKLIFKLHKQNIFHGDLNITNILVNEKNMEDKFLLIDFDKSKRKFLIDNTDRNINLERIAKSLKKNNLFDKNNFNKILEGYYISS